MRYEDEARGDKILRLSSIGHHIVTHTLYSLAQKAWPFSAATVSAVHCEGASQVDILYSSQSHQLRRSDPEMRGLEGIAAQDHPHGSRWKPFC